MNKVLYDSKEKSNISKLGFLNGGGICFDLCKDGNRPPMLFNGYNPELEFAIFHTLNKEDWKIDPLVNRFYFREDGKDN